jgi:hypothetical protein
LDQFRRRAQTNGAIVTGARVRASEDEDAFSLEIELGDEHTVVLTYWKDANFGDTPSVSLWEGTGEHEYGSDTIDDFRIWVGRALGFITAPYGACVDCDFDTFAGGEYYAVHDSIWKAASEASPPLPGGYGLLCIDCLETRLGRELTRADFVIDNPLNRAEGLSDRLRNRLARQ